MSAYQTPGVYYERVDRVEGPAISAIRTDIAGFVGISQRGPLDYAVPVQSWRQFQAYFGEFTGAGYLAYAVRGFFENGGRRCWVVRVATPLARAAGWTILDGADREVWSVEAFSPGVWGNQLAVAARETHRAQTFTRPGSWTGESSPVESTTGFERGTLAHLTQGGLEGWKVVSGVDAQEQRLVWSASQPGLRLPYDAPLAGFDPDRPIRVESVEYDLLVYDTGRLVRAYAGLSLVPEHPRYGPALLPALEAQPLAGPLPVVSAAPEPVRVAERRDLSALPGLGFAPLALDPEQASLAVPLSGGADGLATLAAGDYIGEDISPYDSPEVVRARRRGLRVLEEAGEVSILAVPDIHIQPAALLPAQPLPPCIPDPCLPGPPPPAAPPRGTQVPELPPVLDDAAIFQVQSAMILQCEKLRDRVALLDTPFRAARDDASAVSAAQAWRSRFDSKYAAFYYPWLRVVDPLRAGPGLTREIPPSGHAAGQYARADLEEGVHRAPANHPLEWAQDLTVAVSDARHGLLNEQGINVIRAFPGRGLRIFGARTVSSDPDWRYINVRRLLIMIERAIDLSTQWAVFEPNDTATRAKLTLAFTSFLEALWQRGALAGSTRQAAFFVRCDETNNPPGERENGRLLAEIGVAPSRPFEFVVVRVGRTQNAFEIAGESVDYGGRTWH